MKLLIDTHVLIWMATGDKRLTRRAADTLSDPDQEVSVSVVSRWEIALKHRTPGFRMSVPFDRLLRQSGFQGLDLAFDTPSLIEDLPDIHRDPFDRILVAQALLHDLTLISGDRQVRRYPVPTLW